MLAVYDRLVVLPCVREKRRRVFNEPNETYRGGKPVNCGFVRGQTDYRSCQYDQSLQYMPLPIDHGACTDYTERGAYLRLIMETLGRVEVQGRRCYIVACHPKRMQHVFGLALSHGSVLTTTFTVGRPDSGGRRTVSAKCWPTRDMLPIAIEYGRAENTLDQLYDATLLFVCIGQPGWIRGDPGLTPDGVDQVAYAARRLLATSYLGDDTTIVFGASVLLRSQQACLHIYRELERARRVRRSAPLERAWLTLIRGYASTITLPSPVDQHGVAYTLAEDDGRVLYAAASPAAPAGLPRRLVFGCCWPGQGVDCARCTDDEYRAYTNLQYGVHTLSRAVLYTPVGSTVRYIAYDACQGDLAGIGRHMGSFSFQTVVDYMLPPLESLYALGLLHPGVTPADILYRYVTEDLFGVEYVLGGMGKIRPTNGLSRAAAGRLWTTAFLGTYDSMVGSRGQSHPGVTDWVRARVGRWVQTGTRDKLPLHGGTIEA